MSKYRVALAGTGSRGSTHLMAFQQNRDRFEVVALADINEKSVNTAGDKYGIEKRFLDAGEMLAAVKPDVFCFCTQPAIRLEMVELAVEHKVKGLAYEKPIAVDLATAKKMAQLTRDNGTKAIISHQMKYGEHFRNVKRLIDEGQLGTLHTIHATSKGWMGPYMTHLVDYMLHYNGYTPAEWVLGTVHGRDYLTDEHPSPGFIAGLVQFANGVRGIVEAGPMAPHVPGEEQFWFDSKIAVYGDKGMATTRIGLGWDAVTSSVPGVQGEPGCWNADHDQPPYIRDFADWLDDDAKVHPCNDQDAYKGFQIMAALCRSVIEGGQVALPLTDDGMDEIEALQQAMPDKPVLLGADIHAEEFGG